jgi:hypothetical protein
MVRALLPSCLLFGRLRWSVLLLSARPHLVEHRDIPPEDVKTVKPSDRGAS